MGEYKVWNTHDAMSRVAELLIADGVTFCYSETDGMVSGASEIYVNNMIRRLMNCYGVDKRPNIYEVKE